MAHASSAFSGENQWLGESALDPRSHGEFPPVQDAAIQSAMRTTSAVTAGGGPHQRRQFSPDPSGNAARRTPVGAAGNDSSVGPATNKLAQAISPPKYQSTSSELHGPSQRKRSR